MQDFKNYIPEKGKAIIYRYWYEDKSYIGSTRTSLNDRSGNGIRYCSSYSCKNKFATAIITYGFINFKCEILAIVNEKDRYIIEDAYMRKYDSVNNGYNNRYNISYASNKKAT